MKDQPDSASLKYSEEYKLFLEFLLQSDRKKAGELILNLADKGIPIVDIYKYIFQRSQYEIGRLWETNKISVAQEHFCTAATQTIMSGLYPKIFSTEKIGLKMVACCIGGELHEIGLRMVSDIFELYGWDTYFLGANTPKEGILSSISQYNADLLAISASMLFNITAVKDLIDYVRNSIDGKNVKILVGGRPFNVSENLWSKIGADAYAPDAESAVKTSNSLLGVI